MTDDTPRQTDHCPTCGAAVRVLSSDEGTHSYTPVSDDTTRQAAEQAWLDIEEGEWYGQPPDELWIRGYVAGYAAAEQRAETAERERDEWHLAHDLSEHTDLNAQLSATWRARAESAEQERDEFNETFDLRHKADVRAITRWQEAHPERPHIWPDHADLVVWLLEQWDDAVKERSAARADCAALREAIAAMVAAAGHEFYCAVCSHPGELCQDGRRLAESAHRLRESALAAEYPGAPLLDALRQAREALHACVTMLDYVEGRGFSSIRAVRSDAIAALDAARKAVLNA